MKKNKWVHIVQVQEKRALQQGPYLLKWLLFGREARGKNAPSWRGFSSLSKIDFCIHRGKVERS